HRELVGAVRSLHPGDDADRARPDRKRLLMATAAAAWPIETAADEPRLERRVERLRGALLWLTGFSGAFVFIEPGPYEIVSLLTIIVFLITGLTMRPSHMPLIVLLLLYASGFAFAAVQVIDQNKVVTWVLV